MAGYYHQIDEEEKILDTFPGLTKDDLHAVDLFHPAYLLYEDRHHGTRKEREAWLTCCHRQMVVESVGRTETPEQRAVLNASHNDTFRCPYCGRVCDVKNRLRIKNWNRYEMYEPVLFIHASEDGQTVWAQGYWTTTDLTADPTGRPLFGVTRVYRFTPGNMEMWEEDHFGAKRVHRVPGYWPKEPFRKMGYCSYHVVGIARLASSFLRYTMYDQPMTEHERINKRRGEREDLIRYLAAAARYPRQIEMLRKAGISGPVIDLVYSQKKNAKIMKWSETDPRKAFGLTGQEMKQFMETGKCLQTLEVFQRMKKVGTPVSIQEAADFGENMWKSTLRDIVKWSKEYQIPELKFMRYLARQRSQIKMALEMWEGYITLAAHNNYPLHRENVLLPKNLAEEHEKLVAQDRTARAKEDAEKRKRQAKAEREGYEPILQELKKKYEADLGKYLIRVPVNSEEIRLEGIFLKHCVGGYAPRHMEGKTVILFMRKKKKPEEPWITIEMEGARIKQIHGYRNEGVYSSTGRIAPDPREVYRDVLDPWLLWISRGSRRDKDGRPLIPKMKKEDKIA